MYAGHEGGAYAKNSFGNMYAHEKLCLSLCFPFFFFVVNNGPEQMVNSMKLTK